MCATHDIKATIRKLSRDQLVTIVLTAFGLFMLGINLYDHLHMYPLLRKAGYRDAVYDCLLSTDQETSLRLLKKAGSPEWIVSDRDYRLMLATVVTIYPLPAKRAAFVCIIQKSPSAGVDLSEQDPGLKSNSPLKK